MKVGNSNGTDSYWQWSSVLTERIPHGWLEKAGWVVALPSNTEDPAELLDAHSQRLLARELVSGPITLGFAENENEVAALAHLAEQVAYALRPVYPAPRFRRELRQALLAAHRQQAARRRIFAHPLFERGLVDRSLLERLEINSPWFWQIAAAVPVLIAIAALLWRYAHRPGEPVEKLVAEA